MNSTNRTYTFCLVLDRLQKDYDELEEAFFNAGCDDALVGARSGVVYLDFDREASDFKRAVLSAIRDVELAGIEAKVAYVEPGDLVTAAEISRRAGISRESVRLWIKGERGAGDFPLPHTGISGTTVLWSWREITRWLVQHGKLTQEENDQAEAIYAINKLLRELLPQNKHALPNSFVEQLKNIRLPT